MATPSTPNHPSDDYGEIGISILPGPRSWSMTIPAPYVKPVTKRKTGKVYQRNPMLNANDRDHFRVTSPIRKDWREKGHNFGHLLNVAELGLQHARIDAYIHRPSSIRSDAGNFYPTVKPIIDGLVDAGLLPDDNDDHLQGPFLHKGEKGPYAVTLIVTETEAPA